MAKILSMEGIEKSFFGVQVLRGVDFDLDAGEVHVLLGENGAGKSTLMKILSGAYTLDAGKISVDGQAVDLSDYNPRQAEDLGIVTIYQNFHLIPDLSVAENLSLDNFVRQRGLIRWNKVNAHARAVLDRINFKIDPSAKIRDLPVSQKQMVEIAAALSKNAKVIVMDEPTAALSRHEVDILFETIAEIKAQGIGIIYISHKLEEIKVIGDRITVMRDGRQVATLAADEAQIEQIINLMIGKELDRDQQTRVRPERNVMFAVEGLETDHLSAPITFHIRQGEILGITGLIGSGKTELAQALFGITAWNAGTAKLHGQPVRIGSPQSAIRQGIGYLPKDRDSEGLCLDRSVKENVSMVSLAKMHSLLFSPTTEKAAVAKLVDSMQIKMAGLSQQVKYLSGGNKQKVVFGKWFGADCDLLILDEPTIGIDLIRDFVDEEEHGVLFISSDLEEILEVSDRLLVMTNGALVAELDPKTTTQQDIRGYSL
jgi:ribose transport system ATP-binding protein